jgi:manganese/zinc/iron transport system permease protein
MTPLHADLLRLLTLQDANTRTVLLGTTVLGLAAGVVGTLALLRKRSLMGDAVAHAALPGVCTAFLLFQSRSLPILLAGALLFGALSAAFVAAVTRLTRVREDAAIAIAIGGFFGVGIALSRLIQNLPSGNRAGLDSFIFGKAASMVSADASVILAVAAAVLAAAILLRKEFKLLCFDPDFAAGLGLPVPALDLALMALVCLCTVAGLPAVGVVLMVALLVIPAAAARYWTDSFTTMLVLAAAFGAASALLGTALSAVAPTPASALTRGWPTGPVIVLTASAIFTLSLVIAPRRGLFAAALRRAALTRRIATQNLLRDVYEHLEPAADPAAPWAPAAAARSGSFPPSVLARAQRQHLIAPAPGGYVLTADGFNAAARVVRAHRLWELYLIEQADVAPDHVDRDADQIEHVLSPRVIAALEARLGELGRLPRATFGRPNVPKSPHPIPADPVLPPPPAPPAAQPRPSPPALLLAGAIALALASPASRAADAHLPPALALTAAPLLTADDLWTLATAVVCSVACALVGTVLVLRRLSLLGDAISHAILPGLAAVFLLFETRNPLAMLAGALAVGVLTAFLSAALARFGRVPEDAGMGVVFTTLFALGVVLITFGARNVDIDPGCVLYGLLEFTPFDTVVLAGLELPRSLLWLSATLLINAAVLAAFSKEIKVLCFDPALATTLGFSAVLIHYAVMAIVAATSVAAFEAVGSILVIAMLVAPAATARLITDRFGPTFFWAAASATLAATLGYLGALWLNTSAAGMIAAASLALFVLTAALSPTHGVLGRARAARSLRPDT